MTIKTTLLTTVLLSAASTAHAAVVHVPPAGAQAGAPLELVATAAPTTATLAAYVRVTGTSAWTRVELVRRDADHWVAVVPATLVAVPGIEYYIAAGDDPVFATPAWPHGLPVIVGADDERRARDIVRHRGRRSRVQALGEYVDYGTRDKDGNHIDRYYRFDADFAYRLWTYPLEEIRVGYTRLLGPDEGTQSMTDEAGFKVAGWFELGLAAVEGVRLDGRAIVMATPSGFAMGGRGEARVGDREGSHVALGVEYLADVGTNGYFRLGWGTVPRLPMSATVEITNVPANYRDTGVRLYYDIAREIVPGVRVGLRAGYASRNQSSSGFTGGAGAAVEF
jgi:hypothetical protein